MRGFLLSDASPDLCEEFNATAEAFGRCEDEFTLSALLTKYSLLQNHKLRDSPQKNALACRLFDTGIKMLEPCLQEPTRSPYESENDALKAIMERLLKPESRDFIPSHAVATLADTGLEFLRRAEKATREMFQGDNSSTYRQCKDYQGAMIKMSQTLLSYADQFGAVANERAMSVTTSQPIAPSRPIALKSAAATS